VWCLNIARRPNLLVSSKMLGCQSPVTDFDTGSTHISRAIGIEEGERETCHSKFMTDAVSREQKKAAAGHSSSDLHA
jgi:hypothetical protein